MVVTFRGSIASLIYNKALRYPSVADDLPAVTLMSADIDQMSNAVMYASEVWAITAEIAIGIGLLWRQMGPVALAPVVLTAITAAINTALARLQGKRRGAWLGAMQRRVGLTSHLLGSMKSVKLGGMSEIFAKRLQAERVIEVDKANSFRWLTAWQNTVGKSYQGRKRCQVSTNLSQLQFPVPCLVCSFSQLMPSNPRLVTASR
jgi:ATP-binding cassette, subfamily C (CFTR/MRP), member 1